MKVLVMCEESQEVCKAFRFLGHEAYSVDLQKASGGHPEWHFQMDCFEAYEIVKPDLVIAHPPCTYLCAVSGQALRNGLHTMDQVVKAREFFLRFFELPCKVCVENPRPLKCAELPPPTQAIQPYMFGDPYTKHTNLWLKGLPMLFPECIGYKGFRSGFPSWTAKKSGSIMRSKTFPGIARAMAMQWGGVCEKSVEAIDND